MARKGNKQKPVSVRYWFFAIFLTWILLINLVAVPLLVLFGKDQSKKALGPSPDAGEGSP